jgi:hypothetical protein
MPQPCREGGEGNHHRNKTSSWMEDLFVALCRLVGSKDAESIDDEINIEHEHEQENNQHHHSTHIEHDEIRTMLIELNVVKTCLKALMDEPNTVFGQDPFVTTLAMSFFYTCARFGDCRYTNLKEQDELYRKSHRRRINNNNNSYYNNNNYYKENATAPMTRHGFENIVRVSLDYNRLAEFTLQSLKSFPSHNLIQATGCLILDSIPISYNARSLVFLEEYCCASPAIPSSDAVCRPMGLESSYRRPLAASFVSEIVEPCNRCYF